MQRSVPFYRQIINNVFGEYEILRPRRGRPRSNPHSKPSFVPPFITRPSYVPANFSSRTEGEELSQAPDDPEEGYHGDIEGEDPAERVRNTGRILLGGIHEQTVRYAGRMAAEVLETASSLVKVYIFRLCYSALGY